VDEIVEVMGKIEEVDRRECRKIVEERFSLERMVGEHAKLYEKLAMRY
jgi:glycosyltransferase involved in cell wall biosynthesis